MSRWGKALAFALCALLVVSCLAVVAYIKGDRLVNHLESLRGHLHNMEAVADAGLFSAAQGEDLLALRGELAGARDDLVSIKAELGPALAIAPFLGWLPVVGDDTSAAPDLLEMGIGVTTAGDALFEGMEPLVLLMSGSADAPSSASTMETLALAVSEGQPHFEAARTELRRVEGLRDGLAEKQLSPRVSGLVERLDRYLPLLDTGVEALLLLPSLLGVDEPRAYLLLAQNEQELRATGGFISSVALLRLSQGQILELDFRDSYAVDDLSQPHPDAPQPLEEYMLAQIWLLRDANWYPDFPTSAQVARDLYAQDQGVSVDGVIAADLTAMQLLAGAMEPISIEGYDEVVTAANVVGLMQHYWASPSGEGQTGDWWTHRKDFMGDLLMAMMEKMQMDLSSIDLGRLGNALQRSVREKHILAYMVDPVLGGALSENGWDGAINSTDGDYLMVVDSNVGFNKVNATVETEVHYRVTIENSETAYGSVSVSYDNASRGAVERCVQEADYPPTYPEMMEGCYWNYLRVYVPGGSQLIDSPELALPEGSLRARQSEAGGTSLPTSVGPVEAGKNVFASFFVVAPGEQREMVYQYQLPSALLAEGDSASVYRLVVQKQPGTTALPLRVEVQVPADAAVLSTTPEATSLEDGLVSFSTDLRVDREFEVVFR
jgi:hypothetical protein